MRPSGGIGDDRGSARLDDARAELAVEGVVGAGPGAARGGFGRRLLVAFRDLAFPLRGLFRREERLVLQLPRRSSGVAVAEFQMPSNAACRASGAVLGSAANSGNTHSTARKNTRAEFVESPHTLVEPTNRRSTNYTVTAWSRRIPTHLSSTSSQDRPHCSAGIIH